MSGVDTEADVTERARTVLQQILETPCAQWADALRALMDHPDLAGFHRCPAELEQLRVPRGCGAIIDRLVRASRGAAAKVRLHVAGEDDPGPSLRDAVGAPDSWPDYPVPKGFEASPRGIYKLNRQGEAVYPVLVAEDPIAVIGVGVDVGTGAEQVALGWRRHGQWRRTTVPRELARDARAIVALAGQGLPVSSVTGRDLVGWLTGCEAVAGEGLPRESTTTHLGWIDDATFLAGCDDARVRVTLPAGEAKVLRGWGQQAGSYEGWCEAIRELVAPYPLALLGIYAALAPVLLRVLREDGFTVDWSGDSSGGKTTTMRVAGSVWGRPDRRDGVLRAWDSSSDVGPAVVAAVLHSLPVLLDDTQHMHTERQRAAVASMLYAIPAGEERTRGTQSGSIRVSRTWQTCMLTTGEAPITSFAGATGARARALCLRGAPFGADGQPVVDELKARLLQHHGWLGPRFVAALKGRTEQLREWFAELRTDHASGAKDGITARITGYVALLHMVADICHEELEVPGDSGAAMQAAMVAARRGGQDADRPLEALRDLYAWSTARLDQFDGVRNTARLGKPPFGWLGRWDVDTTGAVVQFGVYKEVAAKQLQGWGYDVANVLSSWRERGWTSTQADRMDKPARVDGVLVRLVVVQCSDEVRALLTG